MNIIEKGTFLKVCLVVLFALGFGLFIAPVFKGIINIGNSSGMAVFAVLIAGTIFSNKLLNFIKWLISYKSGRIILSVFLAVIAVLLLLAAYFSAKMIAAADNYPDKPTTLIILGCKVKGEKPSLMLYNRVSAAADYLNKNPEIKVIVSGGQGEDEEISEAECMRRILIENGISSDRIIIEDKSVSTHENISFSLKLIENLGLEKNITIVTSEFHQYRTSLIAKNLGVKNSYSISSHTQFFLLPTYWIREWFGICYIMSTE
jgi:uncharacterized SAM-binding protein YcdF (DUF218 family)